MAKQGDKPSYITENIRLKELVAIVNANHPYFLEFKQFLNDEGYARIIDFVHDGDEDRAVRTILRFLSLKTVARLYDGVCRPYEQPKAAWYFLSWLFRDAPAQRLGPLVPHMTGETTANRQALLLNEIRKHVAPLFRDSEQWDWPAISEIFLARLEGSRRSLRGNLFEGIVRRSLESLFAKHGVLLRVGNKEVRISDETYDVQVYGKAKTILVPVKTRETMGGGHALLFTRDIFKAISVAEAAGYSCIPVVIAESWIGKLEELECKNFIYIQANPNQVAQIDPLLYAGFENLLDVFKAIAG